MSVTVAALYVAAGGCYYGLPDVEPWGLPDRDARDYAGPHPVVAHPPCERWGRYWHGGPSAKARRKLGDDGGCFAAALASVRQWGGILEHPEASHAFRHFQLGVPKWRAGRQMSMDGSGLICCVAQANYGHRARKLTWLYLYTSRLPPPLDWSIPEPSSRLDYGFHSAAERAERRHIVSPRVNESRLTAKENNATPLQFRDALLSIARSARKTEAE